LTAFLKARLDAGQMSVRESVEAAGQAGHLKRRPDGKWDARPLWDAGRRLGYAPGDLSTPAGSVITGRGKVWVLDSEAR
jgi:hypothetical protein